MKRSSLIISLTVLWIAVSPAQEMLVPVDVQLPLFLKLLAFDRNLKTRVGNEIVIGIVYQRIFRTSLNVKDEWLGEIDKSSIKKIQEIPIHYVTVDISDKIDLAKAISRDHIDILYIAPLRAVKIETITSVSRAKQVITLTGVPDYVESGLAVGIGIKGEKPQFIINLPVAKAEGADLSSQVLKLAKVIQ